MSDLKTASNYNCNQDHLSHDLHLRFLCLISFLFLFPLVTEREKRCKNVFLDPFSRFIISEVNQADLLEDDRSNQAICWKMIQGVLRMLSAKNSKEEDYDDVYTDVFMINDFLVAISLPM